MFMRWLLDTWCTMWDVRYRTYSSVEFMSCSGNGFFFFFGTEREDGGCFEG